MASLYHKLFTNRFEKATFRAKNFFILGQNQNLSILYIIQG